MNRCYYTTLINYNINHKQVLQQKFYCSYLNKCKYTIYININGIEKNNN